MVPYRQKIFGLCLSADVRDKAFFIFFGPKNAGKTQILNAIRRLLGPYAGLLQVETLTDCIRNSSALADMAQLSGIRFAQTSELGADMKLATRALKYLVQGSGSEIKATLKYANPVHIAETWKCLIDCNELPNLEDPDDAAFFTRVHLIRFRHSIPAESMDRDLAAKLIAECPGILAWAVRGFARWQAEGLEKPATVVADLKHWRIAPITSLLSERTAVQTIKDLLRRKRAIRVIEHGAMGPLTWRSRLRSSRSGWGSATANAAKRRAYFMRG